MLGKKGSRESVFILCGLSLTPQNVSASQICGVSCPGKFLLKFFRVGKQSAKFFSRQQSAYNYPFFFLFFFVSIVDIPPFTVFQSLCFCFFLDTKKIKWLNMFHFFVCMSQHFLCLSFALKMWSTHITNLMHFMFCIIQS